MLRFLDAGESHGRALMAIIEGFPSNFYIDYEFINNELKRRQQGYGRGERMKIEDDRVELWSGVRGNKTTGNPISMVIFNKDYENWKDIMNREALEEEKVKIARPGHGDVVGYFKYKTGDIRDTIERTSARETAIRTAVGALCKNMLLSLGIDVRSKINSIGEIFDEPVNLYEEKNYEEIQLSVVRCYNKQVEELMKKEIDNCKIQGDTIGGSISISIKGVPLGLGSYTQWDRKLDSVLSAAIMSLQGIKAIEFGAGLDLSKRGSSFNDEMWYEKEKIVRCTNNSGGIEAGVSNGENIEIKAYMKPIPTIRKNINSVDLVNKKNVISRYERSDVCAVVPASVVLENICAFEILKALLERYSGDDFNDIKNKINDSRE
jgi:chorismate synthase